VNDTISGLDLTLSQLVSGESYVLRDIIFDSSNQIREDSREILNEFVVFLKENPRLRIEIFAPSNKAAIIADYIIKSGIRADRIAVSKRETEEIGYILQ
jgi:outer membrane protein OmpA-like peptidoglycan-associated protein